MKPTLDQLLTLLRRKNIRCSRQRMAILSHLAESSDHPTADQIHRRLQASEKKIAKATVYNTLNAMVEAGIIRVLTIEGSEARYDIELQPHGHFVCESCGAIFHFRVDVDSLFISDLTGFRIREKDVFFKGVCPKCYPSSEDANTKEEST